MALYTWEERFAALTHRLVQVELLAKAAAEYAESAARQHHAAIVEMNRRITGETGWPRRQP